MTTSGQSRYATVNGTNLHYVEWGPASATPLVLLHGLRACGAADGSGTPASR